MESSNKLIEFGCAHNLRWAQCFQHQQKKILENLKTKKNSSLDKTLESTR